MTVVEHDGIPVLVNSFDAGTKTVRIKVRKRKIEEAPLSRLSQKAKKSLEVYQSLGCNPKLKKEAGMMGGYSESSAIQMMNKLLKRKPIREFLEKHSNFRFGIPVDEKVALATLDALEADHPLAKGKKPDHMARLKAVQEINKLNDNYPTKKLEVEEKIAILHLDRGDVEAFEKYRKLKNAD